VDAGRYLGVDSDPESIDIARDNHPSHRFVLIEKEDMAPIGKIRRNFDTIVLLAVIEHIKDPVGFLRELSDYLNDAGKIVLTTPHPAGRFLYEAGALIGLFSVDAAEEHETMLGKRDLSTLAEKSGLKIALYRRFLFFHNQLVIIEKRATRKN
jgi:2-polyprenyl-3-methyl-5-hydroxy-6-metoxy-1,4-benzoquinol methylase